MVGGKCDSLAVASDCHQQLTKLHRTVFVAPEAARIKTRIDRLVDVGFGIKTPQGAQAMAKVADGVVVGSAIVSQIVNGKTAGDVLTFVKLLADGAHRA